MQKSKIPVILMVTIFLFAGCAMNKGATSQVAFNLVNYANQGILMIAELEQKSLERYASVTGENYTTDQRIHDELKDFIIPTYERFVDSLRKIQPEDDEIKKIHAVYINAADLMYNGFKNKMIGIEKKDDAIIIQANENIEKAREECKRWRLELIELYKKYGVAETGGK